MKLRSLLIAFFAFGLVFAPQTLAQAEGGLHPPDDQTKTLSCEQLKQLVMSPKQGCLVADLTFTGFVWCADSQEEFDDYGTDYNYTYWSLYYRDLAPNYQYDFDREECLTGIKAESEEVADDGKEVGQAPARRRSDDSWPLLKAFGINPFDAWLRLRAWAMVTEFYVVDLSADSETMPLLAMSLFRGEGAAEEYRQKQAGYFRQPKITPEAEAAAWQEGAAKSEAVTDVAGFSGIKRYSWEGGDGAVMSSSDWEKVEFKEPVPADDSVTRTVKFKEGEVEVKVKNDQPAVNRLAVDADGFFDLFVIQTHFAAAYAPEKKQGAVVVYEGKVELMTKDGKTLTVAPAADQPGVVVIGQKFSPAKLLLPSLALVVIIGGAIFFKKRKR